MMRAGIDQNFIVAQGACQLGNKETRAIWNWRVRKHPLRAQSMPGNKLQMMGARHVIVPTRQDLCGCFYIVGAQRGSKPAIR